MTDEKSTKRPDLDALIVRLRFTGEHSGIPILLDAAAALAAERARADEAGAQALDEAAEEIDVRDDDSAWVRSWLKRRARALRKNADPTA